MPCYRAKKPHLSTPNTRPGVGASWTDCWAQVACCSSGGGTTGSSSSAGGGTTGSSSSAGGGTTGSSSSAGGGSSTSPSPSPSASPSPSGSSASAQPSQNPGYHNYKGWPCVGNSWNANDCSTSWHSLSGHVPIQIWHSDDTATKYTCTDTNGNTINYTIARITGVGGWAANACYLLIRDDSITATYTAYLMGTATTNCTDCNATAIRAASSAAAN